MKPTYEQLEQQVLEQAVQLANAESKCRELAAENAKLTDCANFYRLGFKPVKGTFGIEWKPTEQLLDDCGNTAIEAIKTPATDAFLAEVRARAIPSDVMAAIQKVARIRIDLNDFDGDKRGIVDCLGEAEESLIEVVNKFAAQLRKGAEL